MNDRPRGRSMVDDRALLTEAALLIETGVYRSRYAAALHLSRIYFPPWQHESISRRLRRRLSNYVLGHDANKAGTSRPKKWSRAMSLVPLRRTRDDTPVDPANIDLGGVDEEYARLDALQKKLYARQVELGNEGAAVARRIRGGGQQGRQAPHGAGRRETPRF